MSILAEHVSVDIEDPDIQDILDFQFSMFRSMGISKPEIQDMQNLFKAAVYTMDMSDIQKQLKYEPIKF